MTQTDSMAAARAAIAAGDRPGARALLVALVRASGGAANGEAWWLLAQALEDPAQQQECYRRASAAGYQPPQTGAAIPLPGAAPPLPAQLTPLPMPSAPPAAPQAVVLSAAPPSAPAAPSQTGATIPLPGAASPQAVALSAASPQPASLRDRLAPVATPAPAAPAPAPAAVAQPPVPSAPPSPYAEWQIQTTINLLGKQLGRVELIREVISACDMAYADAEKLVQYVEQSYRGKVAAKQFPAIALFAVAMILTGLAMSALGITGLLKGNINRGTIGSAVIGPISLVGGVVGLIRAMAAMRRT